MKTKTKTPIENTRQYQVRALNDELIKNRQVEFVISSESVDTYGTVFKQDGADLGRFEKNPVVFYAHAQQSTNPDLLIGTGEVFRDGDQLIGRATLEPENVNPLAEKILRKIEHGTPYMASIGFNPLDGRFGRRDLNEDPEVFYFTRWELLEFSIVPIGSNPDAHKRNEAALKTFKERQIEVKDPETVENDNSADALDIDTARFMYNSNKNKIQS